MNSMKDIVIPKNMVLNSSSINNLLTQNYWNSNNEEIYFDFEDCTWFDGQLSSLLGVLVERHREKNKNVYFNNTHQNVNKILGKNGFYNYYNIEHKYNDDYDTTIQYEVINSREFKAIKKYVKENVVRKVYKLNQDDEFTEEIEIILESLYELLHNVIDHSKSSKVFLCGQHFFKNNELHISFADKGVTIPYNIDLLDLHLKKDSQSIDWATKIGNSTKKSPSSGLGLHTIRNNLNRLGMLTIVSRNGYWEVDSDGSFKNKELDYPFPGTFVNIRIYLRNHSKRLIMNKETTDSISFAF